ncbi:Uu.00g091960.m01.CDS01 [Anthostomella pinea]|uniref:Uu.00g091960.m01.CDS01 n=1 Tax=Anthostomella pinea TaxID=933095 RepID=A0AAI8YKE7_9PEZI|nr:Uu.00g091960.m01.CDS01 [Anthostomella pinea]
MSQPVEGTPEYAAWASEDKGPAIMAVVWTVTIIGMFFAAVRLYVRAAMQGRLQSDDYFIIISVVMGVLSCSLTTLAITHGFGQHFSTLALYDQQQAIIWTIGSFCPGLIAFGFPKLAVVALLTRLLIPGKWHLRFLWSLGIVCQLVLFATIGTLIGRCYPARFLWDKSIEGTCFSTDIQMKYSLFAGGECSMTGMSRLSTDGSQAFSAFVDLYLAIYPSFVLWRLRISIRQKLALTAALGVGFISGIVAIYKTTRVPSLGDPDFTYATADLQMWTVIEGSSIVIASSVPVLQPLMDRLFGRNILGSTRGRALNTPDKAASAGEWRMRSRKRILDDDLEITAHTWTGSQEDILTPQNKLHSMSGRHSSLGADGMGMSPPYGITMTREVTVGFDPAPIQRKDIGIKSWDTSDGRDIP